MATQLDGFFNNQWNTHILHLKPSDKQPDFVAPKTVNRVNSSKVIREGADIYLCADENEAAQAKKSMGAYMRRIRTKAKGSQFGKIVNDDFCKESINIYVPNMGNYESKTKTEKNII